MVGSAWAAVGAHAIVAGLTQLLWLSYAPIATEVAAQFDVSVGAVGWLTNVFPLIYVVLALPAGLALDRWPRRTMILGAALVAGGAVVRVVWDTFAGALAGQVLVSLAQPILLGGVAVIASALLAPGARAAGIAAGSAGVFGGLLLGILMPTLFGGDSLTGLVRVQAALSLLGAVALVVALRSTSFRADDLRPAADDLPEAADAKASHLREAGASAPGGLRPAATGAPGHANLSALLRDPFQRTLLLLAGGGFGAFVALLTWLQALLEPAGIDDATSGGLLLLLVLAGFVTTAFLPAVIVRQQREVQLLRVALPAAGAGFVVLAFQPPLAVVAITLIVIGALLLPALPVMLELAEQHAEPAADTPTGDRSPVIPATSGAASSLLWLAGNLGGFAAALVVGALLDHPALAFGFIAVFTVTIAAVARRRLAADASASTRA